jgi:hypothetical protein
MRLALLASILGLAACGEPAIEVHLQMPGEPTPPDTFDYSCIQAVDVLAIPVGDNKPIDIGERVDLLGESVPCIDLDRAPKSAADLAALLRGRLDIPIPAAGLAGIEFRARAGKCSDNPYHEAILYGGGVYDGHSSSLTINVNHNISCSQATMVTVRPIDMFALAKGSGCTAAAATDGFVYVGDVRPSNLAPLEPAEIYEDGSSQAQISSAVTAVKLPSYAGSYRTSCIAARYADNNSDNATCMNAAPAICGDATDQVVPYAPGVYLSNTDQEIAQLANSSEASVLGIVLDSNRAPVANATISVPESSNAAVFYGDPGDPAVQTFAVATGATATTASGMFVVAPNGLTTITVTAPGHTGSASINVGTGDYLSTAIVELP